MASDAEGEEGRSGGGERDAGIRCPRCACQVSRVYYTRGRKNLIRRVRICGFCGHKYSTKESVTGG